MTYQANQVTAWTLPPALYRQSVTIEGTLISLPIENNRSISFLFALDRFEGQLVKTKIQLAWYKNARSHPPFFQVGDRWQFTARLKPPHNLGNPGGFDSEKLAFARGIRASGYIVPQEPYALKAQNLTSRVIDRLRQTILGHLQEVLADKPYAAFIYALTIGEKFAITAPQWQIFQNTGTNHLMAIAGLHIGFVAGLVFLAIRWLWRQIPRAPLWIPAPQAAAISSLVAALIYAALAGFSIPTQRAVIMLGVFLLGILGRRYIPPWRSLILALIAVLVWDPLSVLEIAFWLSFGAIGLLAYGLSGRFQMNTLWWKHGRAQWVLGIGLAPLTLLFFANASLISPLANSIAIPWVGFITVPLSLLGALLSLIWPGLASYVLIAAEWTLHGIWAILQFLGSQPHFSWQHLTQQPLFILPAAAGFLLLLAPRGFPSRWLGICWVAPLLAYPAPKPHSDELWLTLLDVGQGLSAVVQTQNHILVFDTGAKYSEDYDMGRVVLVPFLRYQGMTRLDKLIISHGDNDHIGGAESLLAAFPTDEIETSVPSRLSPHPAKTCLRGETWQWDGVTFQFLYPTPDYLGLDNNSSCVLKISQGDRSLLLTGDIEKPAEKVLLEHPTELKATLLISPHHGSSTSSTPEFLAAVHPAWIFFPTGYLNRFGFPKPEVVVRSRAEGARLYDTAQDGAIFLDSQEGHPVKVTTFRQGRHFVWNT